MPRPTSGTTLQRPELASLAMEFHDAQNSYIGTSVLPIVPVEDQASDYTVIPTEALLNVPEIDRAARGDYQRGDFEFETATYSCQEYGFEAPVDDVESSLYSSRFDSEMVAAKIASGIVLRKQEKRVADLLFNATTFSGKTAAVTTEWSTVASAVPVTDVKTARQAVYDATGLMPNTAIMSRKVRENLNLNAQIVDRIKYTNPNVDTLNLPDQLVAQALGVDFLLVGGAKYNSADEGLAASVADVWDDEYCLVCNVMSGLDFTIPSIGRTFLWTDDSPENLVMESYREDRTRSDIIRARQHTDEIVMNAAAGYLLSNITA